MIHEKLATIIHMNRKGNKWLRPMSVMDLLDRHCSLPICFEYLKSMQLYFTGKQGLNPVSSFVQAQGQIADSITIANPAEFR